MSKKFKFNKFDVVRVVWNDATADEAWMAEADIKLLEDAEIESYGMLLSCSTKYLIIARSKATKDSDDCIEGTLRIPVPIIKSVELLDV